MTVYLIAEPVSESEARDMSVFSGPCLLEYEFEKKNGVSKKLMNEMRELTSSLHTVLPLFDVSASRENLSQSSRDPPDGFLSEVHVRHYNYNRLSVHVDESGSDSASSSPWREVRASTVARSKEEELCCRLQLPACTRMEISGTLSQSVS